MMKVIVFPLHHSPHLFQLIKKNKQTNEKNIAAKEDDVEDQSSC